MKKFISIILMGMMILSLAACGGNSASSNANSTKNGGEADDSKSNYPEKPITFLVPTGAGGGLDTTTRALTKILTNTKLVSQTTTVENKPGGGQVVGTVEFATREKGKKR